MFEKYNEKARRALFFARYEASKLGSRVIESEHILLGHPAGRARKPSVEIFRRASTPSRRRSAGKSKANGSSSSASPLRRSYPCRKRAKKDPGLCASHEAESMLHSERRLGTPAHRPAAGRELVSPCGSSPSIRPGRVHRPGRSPHGHRSKQREAAEQKKELPFLSEYGRDLTSLAAEGNFDPLIGREEELERIIQILSRRTKNNPHPPGRAGGRQDRHRRGSRPAHRRGLGARSSWPKSASSLWIYPSSSPAPSTGASSKSASRGSSKSCKDSHRFGGVHR